MTGMGWGMGWGGWLFMGLFWLVLFGLILFLMVRLLSTSGPAGTARPPEETPEDILDKRFARGEIDLEAYQAQRAALAQARGRR